MTSTLGSATGAGALLSSLKHLRGPLLQLFIPFVLHVVGSVIAWPAVADTTVKALCKTSDKCSEPLYLSGAQHFLTGVGTMILTPQLGSVSDERGRRSLLLLCFGLGILPFAVLTYKQTRPYVYAYFVVRTGTAMVVEGTILSLILAFVTCGRAGPVQADVTPAEQRPSAFGVMMAGLSCGFLLGTLTSLLLPFGSIFHVATAVNTAALVYAYLLLPETLPRLVSQRAARPLPPAELEATEADDRKGKDGADGPGTAGAAAAALGQVAEQEAAVVGIARPRTSIRETLNLIRSNRMLLRVAVIAFLSSFSESGLGSAILYYLKGKFHFAKDQFAILFLIVGGSSFVSQIFFLPVFVHVFGVRAVLCSGLLFGSLHLLLYGLAWKPWVAYLAAAMASFTFFTFPAIGSIVSYYGGTDDQGKLQGCMSGIRSLAHALSPLVINPLTAIFLGENAPVNLPGFAFLLAALIEAMALFLGFLLPALPGHAGANGQPRRKAGHVQLTDMDSGIAPGGDDNDEPPPTPTLSALQMAKEEAKAVRSIRI